MPSPKWKTVEDLRPDLDAVVGELGRMPSSRELTARGLQAVVAAVRRCGGPGKVAAALGYDYTPRKTWPSMEQLRPHLDPIVAELGRIPTQKELESRRRFDLMGAYQKFGGVRKVASSLGYPYEGRRAWAKVEDLRSHLDPIVERLGRMPFPGDLDEHGRKDLIDAISKFGGPQKVAEALSYPFMGRLFWDRIEDLKSHLDPVVAELQRMPSQRELARKWRRGDLVGAIRKFGGSEAVAMHFGYPFDGRGSWEVVDNLRPHLDPIVEERHSHRRGPGRRVRLLLPR